MKGLFVTFRIFAGIVLVAVVHVAAAQSPVAPGSAQEPSSPEFEGEYSGQLLVEGGEEKVTVGLEVKAAGDDAYRAILYYGGLPDDRSGPVAVDDTVELTGTYEDFTLRLVGEAPLHLQYIHGRFTALDGANNYRGHLDRVVRVQPNS